MSAAKDFILTLNWVDYLIVVAFLRGAFVGYRDGLLTELLRVFTYGVAIVSCVVFAPTVARLIEKYVPLQGDVLRTAAIAVIFVAVFVILRFTSIVLIKFAKAELGFISQVLGLAVGVARWAVILSAFFMILQRTHLTVLYEDVNLRSRFAQPFISIAPTALEYIQSIMPEYSEAS